MASDQIPRRCPVVFKGQAGEYFRIWIINLILSVLTLGIYSAWAKVRTLRYFYGNIIIDGHAFDYHARPLNILIGRIIAVGLIIGFQLVPALSPYIAGAASLLFLAAIPWLINRRLRFNARMTSYRNVRFGFSENYFSAFGVFLIWPLVAIFSFGLLLPLVDRAAKNYLGNRFSYGGRPFRLDIGARPFYWIYFQGFLLLIASLVVVAVLGVIFAVNFVSVEAALLLFWPYVVFAFLLFFSFIATYVTTLVINAVYNKLTLDEHRFSSQMNGFTMAWIALSNLIAIILTLGFAYPWARIRQTRYRAHHTALLAGEALDNYVSEMAKDNAIGEEIAGAFEVEIGV